MRHQEALNFQNVLRLWTAWPRSGVDSLASVELRTQLQQEGVGMFGFSVVRVCAWSGGLSFILCPLTRDSTQGHPSKVLRAWREIYWSEFWLVKVHFQKWESDDGQWGLTTCHLKFWQGQHGSTPAAWKLGGFVAQKAPSEVLAGVQGEPAIHRDVQLPHHRGHYRVRELLGVVVGSIFI